MNRYQTSIIWLGLILIALNIIVHIGDLKSVLFGGPSGNTGGTNSVPPPSQKQNPPLAPGPLPVQPQPQPTPPGTIVV